MDKIILFISSYRATILLLLVYATGLATATFVEKKMGTEAAKMLIYYSPLFLFLQLLMVLNFLLILIRNNYLKRKKWTLISVHSALIVILAGAMTTYLFGKEGQVHIREGEITDQMVMHTSKGTRIETLPFRLELTDFRLNRYPGSQSPSSFESDLRVHDDGEVREAKIFMNNVLDVKGYRFFQASYDQDELGTILSVNKDVAGRSITYSGYLLLMIGFILMFLTPGSRFRKLIRQLRETREGAKKIAIVLVLSILPLCSFSQQMAERSVIEAVQQNRIPAAHAARFGALPVQFRGRMMPMNTFSSEILRKLYKEQAIGSLNADQFMLSFLAMPQMWMQVPLIALPNKQVSEQYDLPVDYAPYSLFFDQQGSYRLLPQLQAIYHRPAGERTATEKDLVKLDEKINIVWQLLNHSMPGIFPNPDDSTHTWYAAGDDLSLFPKEDSLFITHIFTLYLSEVTRSLQSGDWNNPDRVLSEIEAWQLQNDKASLIRPEKLQTEISYNRMNIFSKVRVGYFISGGLLLLLAFMQQLRRRRWRGFATVLLTAGIVLLFIWHMYGMAMRWYVSGHAPWSNSYETMVYIAWVTVLAGLLFGRKSALTLALATLFGGVILFVSGLNWMDPQINTLVPVLKSPWLMFHVAVIVAAYGFFGISFLLGITNLSLMSFSGRDTLFSYRMKELRIINNLSMLAGLALMTIGTFLGAIWANESWGRYWGWDPKETWALITVVVYTIVTHLHLVKRWSSDWLFSLLSVLAFASVLMTFLGVNYLLSGMHSYGQTDNLSSVFVYIAAAFAIIG
ncbi:MAG: cytochrome c biogenesis protein CcsA, partial [Proteiniphilum sp.]|nr:cytochrome c biogenesis protein CcsA [Proteiniphilum sp.]